METYAYMFILESIRRIDLIKLFMIMMHKQ